MNWGVANIVLMATPYFLKENMMSEVLGTKRLVLFEQIIGFTFTKKEILRQALTHSSFANEKRLSKLSNNERLEFLGDAVLELTTSEWLYENYQDCPEGDMTKLRASMVCEPTLALCAKEMNLGKYIYLGKGEDSTGGRERDSILSDALEAVIGAIYVDGGFASAKEFISKHILADIEHKKLFYDSKTILQEIVQSEYRQHLSYELLEEVGPDHNKKFTVLARKESMTLEKGSGRTKKAAEQEAAYRSILRLRKEKENES